jgi:lipopolysaccharide heptosyltransferase II
VSRSEVWSRAERVLCVRLDALGDVLMTGPAVRALKEARPGRTITLLTSPAGAAAAELLPEVDDVIVYEAPWMKATAPREDSRPDAEMIDRLRSARFEAAVTFTVYSQSPLPSGLLCSLAGIPLHLAHCHENPYQLLSDWVSDPEPHRLIRHEVRRQLDLVAAVGASPKDERMSIRIPAGDRPRVASVLWARGVRLERPWVLIHPGSSAPSRRYAPEGYAEVTRRLVREHGLAVVFTGSDSERPLIDSIREASGVPTVSLAGDLSLGELAAAVWLAPVLVSNNTGPVHLAAAVGTPVVDLYALTNPQHTPWMVPCRVLSHDVPCKYCYKSICPEGHHDCLRLVPPSDVARAALELLAGAPARAGAATAQEEIWRCTPSASTPLTTTRPRASSATAV